MSRLAIIDRLILRMAVWELQHERDTPAAVVLDEALELARTFSTEEAVPFVNGVLDGIEKRSPKSEMPKPPIHSCPTKLEQVAQRRANLEALVRLGVAPYPNRFDRTTTDRAARRARTAAKTAEALEAERPEVRVAGRILGIRSFGKANFSRAVGRPRAPSGLRARRLAVRARLSRSSSCSTSAITIGVEGRVFRTKTNELTIWASRDRLPGEVPAAAAGEVARPDRRRDALPPALPRPDRQSRLARVFETRARVVAGIRRFLNARGFLEVETPMMQPIAGGALARPFVTHHNALDLDAVSCASRPSST